MSADRSALVTGGSRGIGRALATMLAEEGYDVTISGRRTESVEKAVEELQGRGLQVHGAAADVSSEAELAVLFGAHLERTGRLDVLVNSAGLGIGGPVEQTATRSLDLMTSVNLRSIVLAYRTATPALLKAGEEHGNALVVNLASMAGVVPQPWTSIYSSTKAAVRAFTASMNRELGPRGIKSTALSPSYVDTDMTEWIRDKLPPEQMITTADVVEMTRALLRLSRWCVIPEIQFMGPGEAS